MTDKPTEPSENSIHGHQFNVSGDINSERVGDTINTGGGDFVAGDKHVVIIRDESKSLPPPEPNRDIGMRLPSIRGFVGREQEVEYCISKLNAFQRVLITGMPGVGKSALAVKLVKSSRDRASEVFWHTFSHNQGLESLVWILAEFLAVRGQPDVWQTLNNSLRGGWQLPPRDTLLNTLARKASAMKLILCFDDVHNVEDEEMLSQFIKAFLASTRSNFACVIMTSRQMPAFKFARRSEVVTLQGLSRTDTNELLDTERKAGKLNVTLTQSDIEALHQRTEGNVQLLLLAIDAFRHTLDPSQLINQLEKTDDVQHILLDEVERRLTRDETELMGATATLLDYGGSRDALQTLLNRSAIQRTIDDLVDRHLLIANGSIYTQHAILRAFYYERYRGRQQRMWHARAAHFYETDDFERDALKAASHCFHAGKEREAAVLAIDHADEQINRGQAGVVQELLALFSSSNVSAQQWISILLARGNVYRITGMGEDAETSYREALKRVDTVLTGDHARFLKAQAHYGYGRLLVESTPDSAIQHFEAGRELLPGDMPFERGLLLTWSGIALLNLGKFEEADNILRQALEILPPHATGIRSIALSNLGNIQFYLSDLVQAQRFAANAVEIAEQTEDQFALTLAQLNLATCQFAGGDWLSAIHNWKKALKIADWLSDVNSITIATGNLGIAYLHTGDLQLADEHLQRASDMTRQHNLHLYGAILLTRLAETNIRLERYQDAAVALAEAESTYAQLGEANPEPNHARIAAEMYLAQGQEVEARAAIEKAMAIAQRTEDIFDIGVCSRTLGKVQLAQGECESARAALQHSLQILAEDDPYELACTKMELSRAQLTCGDKQVGMRLRDEARDMFTQLGAKYDLLILAD